MEEDFGYFLRCLAEAGPKMDAHYFQVEVAGPDRAIFRERVYCYELYHQLRKVLGDDFSYKLDGEIDKQGHPVIHRALGPRKPDFVVHVPGDMDRNLVVMEVKPVKVGRSELDEDLNKLSGFLDGGRYYGSIMLLYGDGHHNLPRWVATRAEQVTWQKDRVLLVWHRGPGEAPQVVL